MQTMIDSPFGTENVDLEPRASVLPSDETIVVMRAEDGSLELLAESATLRLAADDLRLLLFYGSPVDLELEDGSRATVAVDPRRDSVVLTLGGRPYLAPRWAIRAVARGRLPVAYLRAGRCFVGDPARTSAHPPRLADAWG